MKTDQKKAAKVRKTGKRRIQEKKRSRLYTKIFYSFYALTVVALFVAMFMASRYVNEYVRSYEAAQPKYVASAAAQPFYEHDYDTLAQYVNQDIFRVESREDYAAYMDRQLEGRFISYSEVFSGDENLKQYTVRADDMKIGEFTLKHSSEDKFGFWRWSLDSVRVESPQSQTYTVNVPAGSAVYVNGKALTEEDMTRSGIPEFDFTVALPEGAAMPTRCEYQFERYFGVDSLRVVNVRGEDCEPDVAGRTYTVPFVYDDADMAAELDERVIKVVRRLSCYMTNDYSLYNLDKDMVKDSQASKYIRAFDNQWIATHRGYDFLNMDVRNYVRYSDDCFSVETRYDFKIIYYSVDPEIYPTAYRLYFQKEGDTWKLFDFTLI